MKIDKLPQTSDSSQSMNSPKIEIALYSDHILLFSCGVQICYDGIHVTVFPRGLDYQNNGTRLVAFTTLGGGGFGSNTKTALEGL